MRPWSLVAMTNAVAAPPGSTTKVEVLSGTPASLVRNDPAATMSRASGALARISFCASAGIADQRAFVAGSSRSKCANTQVPSKPATAGAADDAGPTDGAADVALALAVVVAVAVVVVVVVVLVVAVADATTDALAFGTTTVVGSGGVAFPDVGKPVAASVGATAGALVAARAHGCGSGSSRRPQAASGVTAAASAASAATTIVARRMASFYHARIETPRVSVLLPYRDAGPTLDAALDGVLAERDVPLELLAIDDGSRDDGPARVAARARTDARMVPLSAGGGLVHALTLGVARARGALLARMDGDDVSLPGRIAAQVAALDADPKLGALGVRVEAFAAGAVGEGLLRYVAWQNELVDPAAHARASWIESPLCHPSVMLRASAIRAVGGYRAFDGPEDYDLWLRLLAAGFRLAKVPRVLLRWRHVEGRATFADPRYARARFVATKAPHLARALLATARPVAVWGAGKTGRRLARALGSHGVAIASFVDIDPRKLGRRVGDAPVVEPGVLRVGEHFVVVAVGARGARSEVCARLLDAGHVEDRDFLCAA